MLATPDRDPWNRESKIVLADLPCWTVPQGTIRLGLRHRPIRHNRR